MKRLLVTLALAVGVAVPALLSSSAPIYADAFSSSNAKGQACAGISGSTTTGSCTTTGKSLSDIIKTIINFLSALIGVAAVVMIMVGGFRYITAAGDAGKAAGAKTTLIYAIIGLVIVAMAQFIAQFVLHEATKPVTTLTKPKTK